MISVIITTIHKGVFFAQVPEGTDLTQENLKDLENVRMAIYWGTTGGVLELAATGPTNTSKISPATTVAHLPGVTLVVKCSEQATKKWLSHPSNK